MEGYLLVFADQDRAARLRYCVLEDGAIKCWSRPPTNGGVLYATVPLTRHHIRVHPVVGGQVCPNRFVIYALEITRNDRIGRFVPVDDQERMHEFAAVSTTQMKQWCNAIHNWKRHSFDDPAKRMALALAMHNHDEEARTQAIAHDRKNLVQFAYRFDIELLAPEPAKQIQSTPDKSQKQKPAKAMKKKSMNSAEGSSEDTLTHRHSLSRAIARKMESALRPRSRASIVSASWLPTSLSLRAKFWGARPSEAAR